jgi:hypothetical protein
MTCSINQPLTVRCALLTIHAILCAVVAVAAAHATGDEDDAVHAAVRSVGGSKKRNDVAAGRAIAARVGARKLHAASHGFGSGGVGGGGGGGGGINANAFAGSSAASAFSVAAMGNLCVRVCIASALLVKIVYFGAATAQTDGGGGGTGSGVFFLFTWPTWLLPHFFGSANGGAHTLVLLSPLLLLTTPVASSFVGIVGDSARRHRYVTLVRTTASALLAAAVYAIVAAAAIVVFRDAGTPLLSSSSSSSSSSSAARTVGGFVVGYSHHATAAAAAGAGASAAVLQFLTDIAMSVGVPPSSSLDVYWLICQTISLAAALPALQQLRVFLDGNGGGRRATASSLALTAPLCVLPLVLSDVAALHYLVLAGIVACAFQAWTLGEISRHGMRVI